MAGTAGSPTATYTDYSAGFLGLAASAASVPAGLLVLSLGFSGRLSNEQRWLLVGFVGVSLGAGLAYARGQRVDGTGRSDQVRKVGGMLIAFGCGIAAPSWLLPVLFVPDRLAYLEQRRLTVVGLGLIAGALLGLLLVRRARPKPADPHMDWTAAVRWLLVASFSGTVGVLALRIAHSSVGLADGDTSVRASVLRHAAAALVIASLAAVAGPDRRRWLAIGFVAAAAGVCGAAALAFLSALLSPHQTVTIGFSAEMGLPFLVAGATGFLVWTRVRGAALLDPPTR